jgi:hypothetical protein
MARPRVAQARTARMSVAMSPQERVAVEFVASARGLKGASLLLRQMTIPDAVKEYHRLRRRLGPQIRGNRGQS